MKIRNWLFTLALLIPTATSASLWNFYDERGLSLPSVEDRQSEARACGIQNYTGTQIQNIQLESCLRNTENLLESNLGAALPTDNYDSFLSSPLSSNTSTVFVNALPTGITTTIYTIFADDGTTPREKIYCTSKAASPNKLTGCTRGVSFSPVSGVIDETAGTGLTHSKNARIAITDNINFSGKALAILSGNQASGSDSLYVGTATSTAVWLNEAGKKVCFGSTSFCIRSNGTNLQWTPDSFTNTFNFTSSSISTLTASTTQGINVTDSQILTIVSTTLGMAFGGDGRLYQKTSSTLAVNADSNGIYVVTSTLVNLVATSTATANKIPIATASGTLDAWITATTSFPFFPNTLPTENTWFTYPLTMVPSSTLSWANFKSFGNTTDNILTVGKRYRLTYDVVANNGGSITIGNLAGGTNPDVTVGNGKVAFFTAVESSLIIKRNISACDITLDNVYLKEVGWDSSTLIYDQAYAAEPNALLKTYAGCKAAAMWCYYNNDPAMGAIYGKLYNWYAVYLIWLNPPRGWRVPSKVDFDQLVAFLGGSTVAGGKLKAKFGGFDNGFASNESGFSAIAGGYRQSGGVFGSEGTGGHIWTSTTLNATNSYKGTTVSSTITSAIDTQLNTLGFYIRLLRNAPTTPDVSEKTTGYVTNNIGVTPLDIIIPFGCLVDGLRVVSRTGITGLQAVLYTGAGVAKETLITGGTVVADTPIVFSSMHITQSLQQVDAFIRITGTKADTAGLFMINPKLRNAYSIML